MKKILVVDDEPAYLKLLCDQLARGGYEMVAAENGEVGLKMALAQKPDLILLDIVMPKMSGLKMLEALRGDSWGAHVPVFLLTNIYESSAISEGMNAKINRYIVKSEMKLDDLLWSIKLYLE